MPTRSPVPAPPADLLDPGFYADIERMHATLRDLRRHGPVWRDEANGLWAVLSHAAVIEVERQGDLFCNELGYRSLPMPPGLERDMIALDDPAHAAQRALVSRRFTPRAVRELAPQAEQVLAELVDGFLDRGEMEVVDDLAAPLPARLTAHLLGFPDERAPDLRSWSERLMRVDRTADDPQAQAGFVTAIMEFARCSTSGAPTPAGTTTCSTCGPGPSSAAAPWARRRSCRRPACSSPAAPRPRGRSSPAASSPWPTTPTSGRRWRPTRRSSPGRSRS